MIHADHKERLTRFLWSVFQIQVEVGGDETQSYIVVEGLIPSFRIRFFANLFSPDIGISTWPDEQGRKQWSPPITLHDWEGKKVPTKKEIEEFIRRKIVLPNPPRKPRKNKYRP
jgi:hypothetical protein